MTLGDGEISAYVRSRYRRRAETLEVKALDLSVELERSFGADSAQQRAAREVKLAARRLRDLLDGPEARR